MVDLNVEGMASMLESEEETNKRDTTRKPSITDVHTGAVELILSHLEPGEDGGSLNRVYLPYGPGADVEKVGDIPDEIQEALELPEGMDTFTFADLFGIEMGEYDYFGNPPRGSSNDDAKDPIDEEWSDAELKGNGDLINDAKTALNGHYCQEIQDRLAIAHSDAGEDDPAVIVAITIPANSSPLVSDSEEGFDRELKRRQYVKMYVQDAKKSGKRAIEYRSESGEISPDERDRLLAENGFIEPPESDEESDEEETDAEESDE